jgi:D-glycero-D-manno-heptose 1,7-bisphosphate phosphatase
MMAKRALYPAVFLDRDGVLNHDVAYAHRPDQIVWMEGAFAALRRLTELGYRIFVVTNQAGVARGYYEEHAVHRLHEWMAGEVAKHGGRIDEFRYCPHHPDGTVPAYVRSCECRKPGPAMLLDLIDRWSVDPDSSYLVGDRDSDMQAADAAGIRGFLFKGGNLNAFLEAILADRSPLKRMDVSPVDAIILAGGLGTRLQSIVRDRPKPLAPVGGVPFLDLLLHQLARSGVVRSVVLAIGHQAEKIEVAYASGERFGLPVSLAVETQRLGTGGGVRNALAQTSSADVLVMNGDSFVDVDLGQLITAHRRRSAWATLTLTMTDTPERYGTVVSDRDGRVVEFREKSAAIVRPASINAGVYVFCRDVLEGLPEAVPLSIETDVLPSLITKGVFSVVAEGRFIDIGVPDTYVLAPHVLKDLIEAVARDERVVPAGAGFPLS